MAGANITMGVNGIDKTGAAFTSIRNRAKATGASIRSIMGGAIAAAGAYLSFRSIKSGIDELGNLSDLAMKAGTSVEFLTKASTAFQVSGLNVGTDQLVKSMQYLEKATGKTGESAFFEAIESLSKIEDPVKRGAEATRMFGRSALELQPLINGGEEAVKKFRTFQELMPGVSSSAANAGDEIADAMTIAGNGMKSIWLKVIGKVCALFGDEFPGGVRAGVLNVINYFEWAFKKIYAKLTQWGTKMALAGQALGNFMFNDYSWGDAWDEYERGAKFLDADMEKQLDAIDKAREDYKAKLMDASVDDLAGALGKNRGTFAAPLGEEIGEAAAKAAHRVTNELIMGGTNASNRLAILGPNFQNEQKKQTEVLKEIAKNTAKTAEQEPADLEVANLT